MPPTLKFIYTAGLFLRLFYIAPGLSMVSVYDKKSSGRCGAFLIRHSMEVAEISIRAMSDENIIANTRR